MLPVWEDKTCFAAVGAEAVGSPGSISMSLIEPEMVPSQYEPARCKKFRTLGLR